MEPTTSFISEASIKQETSLGPFDQKINRQLMERIFNVNYHTLSKWTSEGIIEPTKEKFGGLEILHYSLNDIDRAFKHKGTPKKDKCSVVAVWSQKGGTGKTSAVSALASITSSLIGGADSENGNRKGGLMKVLVIDVDAQADATNALGCAKKYLSHDSIEEEDPTILSLIDWTLKDRDEVMYEKLPFSQVIKKATQFMHVIPSSLELAEANFTINNLRDFLPSYTDPVTGDEVPGVVDLINRAIEPLRKEYDLILFDCPPSVEISTINALRAADTILIPVELCATAIRTIKRNEMFLKKLMDLGDGRLFSWRKIVLLPNKFAGYNIKIRALSKMQELWESPSDDSILSLSNAVVPQSTVVDKIAEQRTPLHIAATRFGKTGKSDIKPAREILNQYYAVAHEVMDLPLERLIFDEVETVGEA
jgi:cellulose biosynthesis protein BcsQ